MSSATTPTNFQDLYVDVLNRVRANTSDAASIVIAKRLVNQGLHDLHIQKNWSWAERRSVLTTRSPYSTGTITITNMSRTILTGSGTAWISAPTNWPTHTNTRAGGKMLIGNDIYEVAQVNGNTAIELTNSYVGETDSTNALSGGSYTYFEDEYPLVSDFWRLVDIRQFSDVLNIPIIPRQEFYQRFPRNSITGTPQIATIIDLAPSTNTAPRPRVLLYPVPDNEYSIPYRYITLNLAVSSIGVFAANLSADTDEPIIPLRYRHALVLYAIAHWYRDRKDDARSQEANAEYVDLVRRMAGDTSPESDVAKITRRRPNRLTFSRTGRRYSVNARFDQIRE